MAFYPSQMLIPDTALSVAGLTSYLKELIEQDNALKWIWIVGEVSSLTPHRNGHVYFSLQDAGATLSCVVWNRHLSQLTHSPQLGKKVFVLGSVQVYPQHGKYQFIVVQNINVGAGLQQMRLQQLRNRLQEEGLFDKARKRPLPAHPQTIAVVTSPSGAAWGDIQRTLKQRYPGLRVLLSPATVQGELAAPSIVAAIKRVELDGRAQVIILARGGGAVEDLACFNDERIVRAVVECSIPVITGLGHERDESLTDLVADFSVHTPTAAAEKVIPKLAEIYTEHRQRVKNLYKAIQGECEKEETRLKQLRARLVRVTQGRLNQETERCRQLQGKLSALDPQAVLKRGYAVAQLPDGKIIRSAENLEPGQEVIILLAEGRLKVKVI